MFRMRFAEISFLAPTFFAFNWAKNFLIKTGVNLEKGILEKYGKAPELKERIHWLWGKTLAIEDEIFSGLSIIPRDINRLLNAEDRSEDFLAYQQVCSNS